MPALKPAIPATDANISFTDVTTNNASTTKHGFLPKLDNTATNFLTGTGDWAVPAGNGAVTGFTASQNTSSPNDTVNASRLLVSASSTNADFVMQPKGTGGVLAQLPDSGTGGGNKRGTSYESCHAISAAMDSRRFRRFYCCNSLIIYDFHFLLFLQFF